MAPAGAGLVLTALPTATPSVEPVAVTPVAAVAPVAAADSPIRFERPQVTSTPGRETGARQTLKVAASQVNPAAAKGALAAPLKSLVPSSPFGARINPLTGEPGEVHRGQDFATPCSTAVFAAAGGTVTFAAWHPYGGGNRVVVDHGHGLSTTYNHLESMDVKVGRKVARGEQLALSGTTGASTGCHLHFEVMVDGEVVDPLAWL